MVAQKVMDHQGIDSLMTVAGLLDEDFTAISEVIRRPGDLEGRKKVNRGK